MHPSAVRDQQGSVGGLGSSVHLCSGLGLNPYLFTLISHRLHSQDSSAFKAGALGWWGGKYKHRLMEGIFSESCTLMWGYRCTGKEKQIFTLDQGKRMK